METSFDVVLFDLDGTLLNTTQAIYESLKHTVNHFTGTAPTNDELRSYMGIPLFEQFSQLIPGKETEAYEIYKTHNLAIHEKFVKPYPNAVNTLQLLRQNKVKLGLVTSKRRETTLKGIKITNMLHLFDAMVFCEDTFSNKPHPAPILKVLSLLNFIQFSKPTHNQKAHRVNNLAQTYVSPAGKLDIPPLAGLDGTGNFKAWVDPLSPSLKILMVGDSPWDILSAKRAGSYLENLTKAGKSNAPTKVNIHIKTAGVTYGAYPRKVIKHEEPDFILNNIAEVSKLCGLQ